MKKKRILFRADGNLIAGYGHVIRLLSLVSMLRKKYSCVFIIQDPDEFLKKQISESCDEIIEIPETKNFAAEAKSLSSKLVRPDDIVVLDGYHFYTEYQSVLKKKCFKLVCIDDLHTIHFVADAVINHSEGIKESAYSKENYTRLYLGTPYVILRKSFLKKALQPVHKAPSKHCVFINMGGTDQRNYTAKALKQCLTNKNISEIDIVVGSFYPHKNELAAISEAHKKIKIRVHSNLSEKKICSLMERSFAGICSASTVSYEYANAGGILFVYQTVTNQKNIYSFLIKSKVAFPANDFNERLAELKDKARAQHYFQNRLIYFSGSSAKNIASVFEKLELERELSINPATAEDVLTYFKWVNDPEVRQNSVNTAPILFENHKAWFAARLKSNSTFFYIIKKNNVPLGQVRFDREGTTAEIDYSIGKKFRGKGYGEIILKMAISKYRSKFPGDTITAKAKDSNMASNRVFQRLGFAKNKAVVIDKIRYSSYSSI